MYQQNSRAALAEPPERHKPPTIEVSPAWLAKTDTYLMLISPVHHDRGSVRIGRGFHASSDAYVFMIVDLNRFMSSLVKASNNDLSLRLYLKKAHRLGKPLYTFSGPDDLRDNAIIDW